MAADPEAVRGAALLQSKGCLACHSVDGTARQGPTLKELWGRKRAVVTAGDAREIVVDESYLGRSLREPDADVVAGYRAGSMPRFDVPDADVHAIGLALQDSTALGTARGGSIMPLASAAAAFVLLHFVLSSIPVRTQVIAALKAKGFGVVYSILVLGAFAGMVMFFRTAPIALLWSPPRWTRWVPVLVMPLAYLFLVAGFSTPSPTGAGQENVAKQEGAGPKGIQAVTRHPALWGFAVWALSHLATNGELHVVIVAVAILVLALGGMLHIDARRRVSLGAAWDAYAAKTSILPFAAIAAGRARLVPAEIGVWRVLIAAAFYVAMFFAHPYLIGASPVP